MALADTRRTSQLKAGEAMSENFSGGFDFTAKMEDVTEIAVNPSNLATEDQMEIPKQNGRFIVAMVPAKKSRWQNRPRKNNYSRDPS